MNQASSCCASEIKGYSSYFNMIGNVPFDEAEVVCIADNPGCSMHSQERLTVIQRVGFEALILGEKIPYGENLSVPQAGIFGQGEITLTGWDIPALYALTEDLEKELWELAALINCIKQAIRENQWGSFCVSNSPFVTLLRKISNDWVADRREIVNLMFAGDRHRFLYRIEHVLTTAVVKHRIKRRVLFKSTFQVRLSHLKYAVEEGLKAKKKVVVSANGHFLIQNPFLKGEKYEIGGFESFLRERKFVILFPKSYTPEIMQSSSLRSKPQASVQPQATTSEI